MNERSVSTSIWRSRAWSSLAIAGALLLCAHGCQTKPPADTPASSKPKAAASADPSPRSASPRDTPSQDISPTDSCATQLHNICGPLLAYYAINRKLPSKLEDLRTAPGGDSSLSFACPTSGKPYVYRPEGVAVIVTVPQRREEIRPDFRGHVILFDPEPSHSGHHWAIAIDEPKEGMPFLAKVMAVHPQKLAESMRR